MLEEGQVSTRKGVIIGLAMLDKTHEAILGSMGVSQPDVDFNTSTAVTAFASPYPPNSPAAAARSSVRCKNARPNGCVML